MDTKVKLSTLWIIVMINLLFADILTIFVELVKKNTLDAILGEVTTTMAIAVVVTNIPILMIYFSRSLTFRANRILNIFASVITIFYVTAGGSLMPHYIISTTIEVIALLLIIWTAWKWQGNEKNKLNIVSN